MKAWLIASMVLPLAAGCAQMRVQVDVFNKEYEQGAPFVAAGVAKEEKRAAGLLSGGLERAEDEAAAALRKPLDDLFKQDLLAKETIDDYTNALRKQFEAVRPILEEGVAKARLARSDPTWWPGGDDNPQRRQHYLEAAAKFDEANRALAKAAGAARTKYFNGLAEAKAKADVPGADPRVATKVASAQAAAPAQLRKLDQAIANVEGLIGGYGIFTDPNASLIVNAPDAAWRGTFNRTYGLGVLGNTDIAVKMEDIANFSLKGVRNDSTKVQQAAMNSANLLVKTVAAFYGVPVGGAAPAVPPAQPDGQAADDELADGGGTGSPDAAEMHRRRRLAARAVLDAIAREAAALDAAANGDPEKAARTAAVQRVGQSFAANKPELKPN